MFCQTRTPTTPTNAHSIGVLDQILASSSAANSARRLSARMITHVSSDAKRINRPTTPPADHPA